MVEIRVGGVGLGGRGLVGTWNYGRVPIPESRIGGRIDRQRKHVKMDEYHGTGWRTNTTPTQTDDILCNSYCFSTFIEAFLYINTQLMRCSFAATSRDRRMYLPPCKLLSNYSIATIYRKKIWTLSIPNAATTSIIRLKTPFLETPKGREKLLILTRATAVPSYF